MVSSKRLAVIDDVVNSSPQRVDNDQYEALVVGSVLGRDAYLYGIPFCRASSRLSVIDEFAQFIAAARRKQWYPCEAVFVRSVLGRGSRVYSIGFSSVS